MHQAISYKIKLMIGDIAMKSISSKKYKVISVIIFITGWILKSVNKFNTSLNKSDLGIAVNIKPINLKIKSLNKLPQYNIKLIIRSYKNGKIEKELL